MSESRFDPAKHLTNLNGSQYLEVRWRVMWFREDHPDGRIDVDLIDVSDTHARCKAAVSYPYRVDGDGPYEWALATGYGTAFRTDSKRRGDKFAERSETAALGRALAHLGYGTQFATELDEDADEPADAPVERRAQPARPQPAPPRSTTITRDEANALMLEIERLNYPKSSVREFLSKHGLARVTAMNYMHRDELRARIAEWSAPVEEPQEVEA